MPIPSVACGSNVILNYSTGTQSVNLSATATNSPISWRWEILDVPSGSTAMSETRGDFINGVAIIQNPDFETDSGIEGGYVFECIATNNEGDSDPDVDKSNGQQIAIVKTSDYGLMLPGNYQWNWGYYNNNNFLTLESTIASLNPHGLGSSVHSSTSLANLNSKISDANLDDSGDLRDPNAHASSHENGGSDEISVNGLSGTLADKQDADKIQGRNIDSSVPTDGQALVWNNSLTQWEPQDQSGSGGGTTVSEGLINQTFMSGSPLTYALGGTFVDIPGVTVNITTTTDERVLVLVNGNGLHTGTGNLYLDILIDGSQIKTTHSTQANIFKSGTGGYALSIDFSWMSGALTSGSHTIKVQGKTNSGLVLYEEFGIQVVQY